MRNLLLSENSYDYQQIARKTQCWCYDDSTHRENIGIERLFGASRAGHQDIAGDNKHAGDDDDAARSYGGETGTVSLAGSV